MKYLVKSRHRGFPQDTPNVCGEYPWHWLAKIMITVWYNYVFHETWIEVKK